MSAWPYRNSCESANSLPPQKSHCSQRQSEAGAELADLHRLSAGHFGWDVDNVIGATPQINTPTSGWPEFFADHRLRFQLELAAANGYQDGLEDSGQRLLQAIDRFFESYSPEPSLLHGDLWGGNWGVSAAGAPAAFDPAVYFGDREADLAMTELFGGFPKAFYVAYNDAWQLNDGYPVRKQLYNLYHVLNHLNLFGDSYLGQAMQMIDGLLAEVGRS